MGRYTPQVTHTLLSSAERPAEDPNEEEGEETIAPDCSCQRNYGLLLDRMGPVDLESVETQSFGLVDFSLAKDRRNGNWDPHSPYLVVRTDAAVIDNHNDLFDPVLISFLTRYLQGYLQQEEEVSKD